jgi:YD repeat-containing protein
MSYNKPAWLAWLVVLCSLVFGVLAERASAAYEKYDYDATGRLIRAVDGNGQATEYVYDMAGNLLEVRPAGAASAPAITSVAPNKLRRGESKGINILGTGLTGSRLSYPQNQGLDITDFFVKPNEAGFNLKANENTTLGAQNHALQNAAGTAAFSIQVDPVLPKTQAAPTPLAVPPDGTARRFTVRLSNADVYEHTVNLSTSDATIAKVTPASITFAPGQTEAVAYVTGYKGGTTAMQLVSPSLGAYSVPVFVTAEFVGISTSHATVLGVVLETAPTQQSTAFGPFVGALLGIARGPVIEGISPAAMAQDTGPTDMVVYGRGLEGVTGMQIQPADGLTLGAVSAMPDGSMVTVPVTVSANAAPGFRRLTLTGGGQTYLPARADADRLRITLPRPEILSVEPLFARPGDSFTLTVRGNNLQSASAVSFTPATHISVDATPVVSADATQLTVRVTISPLAAAGQRVVRVTTPAGDSSGIQYINNTFTIVNEIKETMTPITAAVLGVVKETEPTSATQSLPIMAPHLGLALGPVVTGLSPGVGSIGETVDLAINGQDLAGVTAVEMSPATGLTLGAPTVSADGRSVNLGVTISATAPQVPRQVIVKAGSQIVPVVPAANSQFRVVAPQPVIQSISPLHFVAGGSTATLTVRGRNFQTVESVRILPADGITVSTPPAVNSDGSAVTVNVTVAAAAVLGPRVVVVKTAAGETSSTASPENTVTIVSQVVASYTPISAASLGVIKETASAPISSDMPVYASNLGVLFEQAPVPGSISYLQPAAQMGVALGPIATKLTVPYLYPGASGDLIVGGLGLDAVAGASVTPAQGVTLAMPIASADGSSVSVGITVAADAPSGPRQLKLVSGAGVQIHFADTADAVFTVAKAAPRVDSVDPILADQGDSFTLLIRGAYLQGSRVLVEPADGIVIGSGAVVNTTGTELTVPVSINPTAPIGARIIRVESAGGITPAEAHPSNTFTVYPLP